MTEEGEMTSAPLPDWIRPVGGFTAMDLDHLPDLPPHTELIDGGLVFVSPQRDFHTAMIDLLVAGLRRTTPARWRVRREMSIVLDERQRPEPDVCIVEGSAVSGPDITWYPSSSILLTVEVVSPDSQIRDRERKPQLYARAGIPHFWRVEEADGRPVVYVYELDPATRSYAPTGIYHGTLKTDVPFPIDIDLDAVRSL